VFGESLFRPSERDLVTIQAAPTRLALSFFSAGLSTLITHNSTPVPTDEVWCVAGIQVTLTPGAAQTAVPSNVGIFDTTTGTQVYRFAYVTQVELGSVAAAQTGFDRQFDGVFVMPGEVIRFENGFSAAGASNSALNWVYGLKIPRGNLLK
jgi:hypothetical protein